MRSSAVPFSIHHALLAAALGAAAALAVPLSGCATRASEGAYAPDSTYVYASKRASDVGATITFALKGSKKAEEAKRAAEEARKAEIAAKKRAAEEKKAAEREKDSKKKSGSKKKSSKKKSADTGEIAKAAAKKADAAPGSSKPAAKKPKKSPRLVEDRSFEIEEGARVQATVTLADRLARGHRPLLVHMVWLKPGGKRTFKKQFEFDPTGADSTLTGALTISPERRAAGEYTLQVFLFRELVAEKTFDLTGAGLEVEEGDDGQM